VLTLGGVGLAIIGAGVLVNGYLAIVARNTSAAEYAYFGAFWSLALVVGVGVFLPIEQETARLVHVVGSHQVLRGVASTAGWMTAILLVVVAAGWVAMDRVLGGDVQAMLALTALCVVSPAQFVVRGALIGDDRMGRHALIMLSDATLRVLLCLAVSFLVADPGTGAFAWTLVVAIAVAHAPDLVRLLRRAGPPATPGPVEADAVTPGVVRRAVAPLLLGSLCAQLLLNGPPMVAPALAASEAEITRVGLFVGAFTLARMPVFLAVPLQTALLPLLIGVLRSGERATLRRLVLRITAGIVALGVAATTFGLVLGPSLVDLVLGSQYVSGRSDVALLALGVAFYIGQLLMTQVLVASNGHRVVAASWLAGVVAGAIVLVTVSDAALAAELAFLVGSFVGWSLSTALVLRQQSPAPRPMSIRPPGPGGRYPRPAPESPPEGPIPH
jgi:O-antigen/teichoic acid export membrane protein